MAKLSKEVLSELNTAWLGYDGKSTVFNPLTILRGIDEADEFHKKLTWLLMQPEYFSFLCKHIFNIDLLPMQALFLKEMWNRKFPMLIGSRGLGKTFLLSLYCLLRALLLPGRKIVVVGAAFRQSKFLHEYMENIYKNAPVLRDICDGDSGSSKSVDMCRMTINGSVVTALPIGDGCVSPLTLTTYDDSFGVITDKKTLVYGNNKFRSIDYNIDNGVKPTKIVTTKRGYSYEATHNHAMKVLRSGEVQWVRTDDMQVGDRILIDRSIRWHNGDSDCTEDDAYNLGLLIGDGSWTKTDKVLRFATKDDELSASLNSTFFNGFTQQSDGVHWNFYGKKKINQWVEYWGLKHNCKTIDKELPATILRSSKSKMSACISGLMDSDGHVFVSNAKGGTTISVNFTNTSKRLVEQLQYILLHYGIVSTVTSRDRDEKWNRSYELGIYGKNVKIFAEEINFRLSRKRDKLNKAVSEKINWNSFGDDIPLSCEYVENSIDRTKKVLGCFTKSKIASKKSFQQGFLERLLPYCNNPELSELVNSGIYYDEVASIEDSECHTYDIHVPEGNEYCANGFFSHNSKIRGQRANDIICDEFASQSRDIFENVVAGFAAVSASPAENVRRIAAIERAISLGIDPENLVTQVDKVNNKSNQIILSGTAYYDFNHFADYWRRWKTIIKSKGDARTIQNDVFGGELVPSSFDWRDYSVMRIPVDLIPKGFMDEGQVARSKATVHSGIYSMEFGAVFAKDSQGFFRRSLIESCVGTDQKPVVLSSGNVFFDPMLIGSPNRRYVMGVDPASEVDKFSIVIVELHEDHRRVVYCWTTTRKDHVERVKAGVVEQDNFYSYCGRKIRELMRLFNIVHIALDSQGGGISVAEALHDSDQLENGELQIWPTIDHDKPKDTDGNPGLHILELCQFANYSWYSESNHGMRKDFEDKVLLLPRFDQITIGLSIEADKSRNRLYDTLEDCVLDLEELKNELSLIEITKSNNGRDHWDTPEVKTGVGRKSRLRKDRYSSLLMANMAARIISRQAPPQAYQSYGGFATGGYSKDKPKVDYSGPSWFTEGMKGVY